MEAKFKNNNQERIEAALGEMQQGKFRADPIVPKVETVKININAASSEFTLILFLSKQNSLVYIKCFQLRCDLGAPWLFSSSRYDCERSQTHEK